MLEQIKEIIEKDKEDKKAGKEVEDLKVSVKGLEYQKKLEIVKYLLQEDEILNSNMILNIFLLIRIGSTFDDAFFASENIWFCSLEEFLDFRIDLKNEIQEFEKKLVRYYLGVLTSIHLDNESCVNGVVIPYTFQRLLLVMDFLNLSPLLSKHCDNIKDVPITLNALNILITMSDKLSTTGKLMEMFKNDVNITE